MPSFPLDPETIAAGIGIPLQDWPGNCAAIAMAVLERYPIAGARYARGLWHGPVASTGTFKGRPFSGHSWIVLADGRVLDPTRYAFGDEPPAVYLGVADHYDEGGIALRRDQPPPAPAAARAIAVTPAQARSLQTVLDPWRFVPYGTRAGICPPR